MRPIKRAIVLCWIMLVACFVIKLFGGNWFEVVCTNEHFSNFCKLLDDNINIKYAFAFVIYLPQMYMFYIASARLKYPTKEQKMCVIYFVVISWASQFISVYVKFVIEIIVVIFCPLSLRAFSNNDSSLLQTFKKTWYYGIVGFVINLSFQLISLITRNIGIKITDESTLITVILMLDYYIMIALYYCHNKLRKE